MASYRHSRESFLSLLKFILVFSNADCTDGLLCGAVVYEHMMMKSTVDNKYGVLRYIPDCNILVRLFNSSFMVRSIATILSTASYTTGKCSGPSERSLIFFTFHFRSVIFSTHPISSVLPWEKGNGKSCGFYFNRVEPFFCYCSFYQNRDRRLIIHRTYIDKRRKLLREYITSFHVLIFLSAWQNTNKVSCQTFIRTWK